MFNKKDPYHVQIDSAVLISGDGSKSINLVDYMLSISIVEDIFSPFVHCEVNIMDYNSISITFPLIGEEYLSIVFDSGDGEKTKFDFIMYRNSYGGFSDTNNMQYYTLFGTTIGYAADSAITVSKSYSSLSYAGIVDDLFNSYFSKLNKPISVEPTKGIQKFIVPGISPFKAIDLCRKRSISVKEPYTPYVFFENRDGYKFVSLNNLFASAFSDEKSSIVHVYAMRLNSNSGEGDNSGPNDNLVPKLNTVNDVLTFDINEKYNTFDKLRNRVYYSSVRYFDLTTKSFSVKEFKLSDKKNNFVLGNAGEFNTPRFIDNFTSGALNSGPFTVVDMGRSFDQSSIDFYPEAMASINAYKELIMQEIVTINTYGNNTFKAGDRFRFGALLPDGKVDPTVGGNYLITSVKHVITFDTVPRYVNALQCLRGNYITDIGKIDA